MDENAKQLANLVTQFQLQIDQANEIVKKNKAAIAVLQDVCTHRWEYQGHSHNDDYFICSICKKEKWQ